MRFRYVYTRELVVKLPGHLSAAVDLSMSEQAQAAQGVGFDWDGLALNKLPFFRG